MTNVTRAHVVGVVPPVCTPLTPSFEIDVPSLERLVDFLIEGGVQGLFILGSTSEVVYLPDGHRRRVMETAITHVAGRVPVIVGAIDTTTLRVIEQAEAAVRLGADGVVVTAPFYTRTHPLEIERHFRLVAERVEAPVYAYDIPVAVHSKLDQEMVIRLAEDGVIAGIKDSSGDADGLRRLTLARASRGEQLRDFSILTGSELVVDMALQMGADGAVPGLANVDPHGFVSVYEHGQAGDWAAAAAEQERLMRLFSIVDAGRRARMGRSSAALGAFKAALHLRGVIACPVTLPPQISLDETEVATIRSLLDQAGLLG